MIFCECQLLLHSRSDSDHESSRRIKTEFLVQLDGANSQVAGTKYLRYMAGFQHQHPGCGEGAGGGGNQ